MRTGIWQLLPKETEGAQHQSVSSALFSYRYDSFKTDRVQTLRAHWSICSSACQMCSTYCNSLSPATNLECSLLSDSRKTLIWRVASTRYHQENTIERYRYGGAGWLV
ncbi:hypothetical protein TNCV_4518491 [Trichonephila clavipes]|nr:hypothetical protein TNCV_4518491 [Trichonephila clavipes]